MRAIAVRLFFDHAKAEHGRINTGLRQLMPTRAVQPIFVWSASSEALQAKDGQIPDRGSIIGPRLVRRWLAVTGVTFVGQTS